MKGPNVDLHPSPVLPGPLPVIPAPLHELTLLALSELPGPRRHRR
jgi:hypothetical protein